MAPRKKTKKIRKLTPAEREALANVVLSGEKTKKQAAKQFGVTRESVSRILKRAQSGQFADSPRSGRPKKLSKEDEERIREIAAADPERSIRRVQTALTAGGGPVVCRTTIGRVLHKAGFLPLEPEKIQFKPGLSRTFAKLSAELEKFENTKRFADSAREAFGNGVIPNLASGKTVNEELSHLLEATAAKYGAEGETGRFLQAASEILANIGAEERLYADYVRHHCVDQLGAIDDDCQIMAHASNEKDLKAVTEEMFVAKRKLRNAVKNRDSYREKANIATHAFEIQKEAIEHIAPNIPGHREKHREIIKTFIEAQRVFHFRAANVIESALASL